MARRGDVLVVKRRLGFSGDSEPERFVVLQSDVLAGSLDTVLVAPLDADLAVYTGDPLVVRVSSKEAGTRAGQVALPSHTRSAFLDRFEPGSAGRLRPGTMNAIGHLLRLLLEL